MIRVRRERLDLLVVQEELVIKEIKDKKVKSVHQVVMDLMEIKDRKVK